MSQVEKQKNTENLSGEKFSTFLQKSNDFRKVAIKKLFLRNKSELDLPPHLHKTE